MSDAPLPLLVPEVPDRETFTDPARAVDRLEEIYIRSTRFLSGHFSASATGGQPGGRVRAYYPEIRLTTTSFTRADSRLSFGHVAEPGSYSTTVTRPDLFRNYLIQQIDLLMQNHGVPVEIGVSATPMPVHFAVANDPSVSVPQEGCCPIRSATCSTCPTSRPPTTIS